jgi:hypothetical protein
VEDWRSMVIIIVKLMGKIFKKFYYKKLKIKVKLKKTPPTTLGRVWGKKGKGSLGYRIQGIKTQKWKPLTNSNIIMSYEIWIPMPNSRPRNA